MLTCCMSSRSEAFEKKGLKVKPKSLTLDGWVVYQGCKQVIYTYVMKLNHLKVLGTNKLEIYEMFQ